MPTSPSPEAPNQFDIITEGITRLTRDALRVEIPSTWTAQERWSLLIESLVNPSAPILEGFIRAGAVSRLHSLMMLFRGFPMTGTVESGPVSAPSS